MTRRRSTYPGDAAIDWSRKFQGAAAGFACGSVIGMVGTVLHTRRLAPRAALPAAMFMGTVLAIGGAIRTN